MNCKGINYIKIEDVNIKHILFKYNLFEYLFIS